MEGSKKDSPALLLTYLCSYTGPGTLSLKCRSSACDMDDSRKDSLAILLAYLGIHCKSGHLKKLFCQVNNTFETTLLQSH